MATKFLSPEAQYRAGVNTREVTEEAESTAPQTAAPVPTRNVSLTESATVHLTIRNQEDAPPCPTCGSIMIRSGACYKCANCGTTSGCA
jgi:ribonucleoside-diphosphate reductase alpha chain